MIPSSDQSVACIGERAYYCDEDGMMSAIHCQLDLESNARLVNCGAAQGHLSAEQSRPVSRVMLFSARRGGT